MGNFLYGVSRQEFEEFKSKHQNCDKLKEENIELKKQIESLKLFNSSINEKTSNNTINKGKMKLSKTKINNYVDEIINNSETNIRYLPDFVEKQIYRNVFRIGINLMDKICESSSINIFGHTLSFEFDPEDNKNNENSNKNNKNNNKKQ